MSTRLPVIALSVALVLSALAACSNDSDSSAPPTSTTPIGSTASTAPTGSDETERPDQACERPVADAPDVESVADVPSDHRLTSFDGTEIRLHWFPNPDATADDPSPTVLSGPGWSLPGETSPDGAALFGSVGIGALNERGYNVLTWDPRGFGKSTGTVTVDHPDFEGRDVSLAIDWLAGLPEVLLDAPGDPRVGMIGSSYGGGIQLAVASQDCRVDALVPGLAWHSLETSLLPNDTVKIGWAEGLIIAASGADLDPHVRSAFDSGLETGRISDEDRDWFLDRGPGEAVGDITAPTLFVHGTVDTLFAPGESLINHEILREAGVPTALTWFCGGHGACLTSDGDAGFVEAATLAWLDRWLRDDDTVEMPPGFQTVDQHGTLWLGDDVPDADATVTGAGDGALDLVMDGGAGPLPEGSGGALSFLVDSFTPARAVNAAEVTITADLDGMVVGAPTLRLAYAGSPSDEERSDDDRPTRVFAQLIDEATGHVVGNQITPVPVELDGERHEIEIEMEAIAHLLEDGDTLTLQIVATTVAYALPRLGGSIEFESIEVDLPVSTDSLAICGSTDSGLGCPPLR